MSTDTDPTGDTPSGRPRAGRALLALAVVVGAGALVLLVVLGSRWLLTTGGAQDFVAAFPGAYELPAGTPQGFPGWLQWQHFLNAFLMVMIIRSGMQIYQEKERGGAAWMWTPRRKKGDGTPISLTLWLHLSLDVLWLVNGVVFIALLIVSGQWARVVPTDWAVFPNALSALLQYVSLDWPTENGWANYNSLQQLSYFVTIFVAAPLAAVTGARLSHLWPKRAARLTRAFPERVASAVHPLVMLYFIVFIVIHVTLVLSTGALRNLNHIYGGADVVNWTGFWLFLGSLLLIVGMVVVARPFVLAPVARLAGAVERAEPEDAPKA